MSYQAIKDFARTIPWVRRLVRRARHAADVVRDAGHRSDLYYYKRWARHDILKSECIPVGFDASFELRMLTCKRDVIDALWTLKSFFWCSELRPRVVIHEDGSFDEESCELLRKHLPGVAIERRVDSDARMRTLLADYPSCARYRFDPAAVMSLKLFDVNMLSTAPGILLIDADILFFRPPADLRRHIQAGTGCYMRDYQDAFVTNRAELEAQFEMPVLPMVNCGLLFFPRQYFDLAFLERYFTYVTQSPTVGSWHLATWGEQTAYALLMSRSPGQFAVLPETYAISKDSARPDVTCGHFVNDGSRNLLYVSGMKRLRKAGALRWG